MFSLIFAAIAALPALALGGVIVFVLMRYLRAKEGPSPIRVDPGQAAKLFEAALAGNKPMVIEALRKAFEFDIGSGNITSILAEWALFEIEQRVKDPSRPAHAIEAIAKFTGMTQEEVLTIVREDFRPKRPVTIPVTVAASAALLLIVLTSPVFAASPASAWGMPVTGPQRFYERDRGLIVDPPLMRDQRGELIYYQPVSSVQHATGEASPVEPPNGVYSRLVYSGRQRVGFWHRTASRRFVSAPVRFLGRLFRRKC